MFKWFVMRTQYEEYLAKLKSLSSEEKKNFHEEVDKLLLDENATTVELVMQELSREDAMESAAYFAEVFENADNSLVERVACKFLGIRTREERQLVATQQSAWSALVAAVAACVAVVVSIVALIVALCKSG